MGHFHHVCYLLNVSGCPESVTIKYFEKGHTFMNADSFHHQIEKEMRSKKIFMTSTILRKSSNHKAVSYSWRRETSMIRKMGSVKESLYYPSLYYTVSKLLCSRNQRLKCSGRRVTSKKSSNRVSFLRKKLKTRLSWESVLQADMSQEV